MAKKKSIVRNASPDHYDGLLGSVVQLLENARRTSARTLNSIMTATYWEIGRRIVEVEQGGSDRAEYGSQLIGQLAVDLKKKFGRGFSKANLEYMRRFYQLWPIAQTVSGQLPGGNTQTPSGQLKTTEKQWIATTLHVNQMFPLPWSHYVRLLKLESDEARQFYESEAIRGGWSVRQLDRQVSSQFYERTLLSRNKTGMLAKGTGPVPGDILTPEEEIKDPFVLEFLNLKDEYSERDLEDSIIHKLEDFLLELGNDFAFIGRQRRLRIGDQWFRIDLLFFHRKLKCLVVIDLKIGKFTHADAGQMHMYLNYAAEHWTHADENPPVGLILCAEKDDAVAHYALDGLPNKVMAGKYRLALPDEATLAAEVKRAQRAAELQYLPGKPESKPTTEY